MTTFIYLKHHKILIKMQNIDIEAIEIQKQVKFSKYLKIFFNNL